MNSQHARILGTLAFAALLGGLCGLAAADPAPGPETHRADAKPRDPLVVAQAATPTQTPASSLPGGASQIQETYRDWQVACVQQAQGKRCAATQVQLDPQSHQRVLDIEINESGPDKIAGVLLLPFGLALDRGATLQIDDGAPGQPLRFRTCIPAGCLIPLTFDAAYGAALRKATALKIKAVGDGGQDALFSVSLKGFGDALNRIGTLTQ
jgi:invasion protein IalB